MAVGFISISFIPSPPLFEKSGSPWPTLDLWSAAWVFLMPILHCQQVPFDPALSDAHRRASASVRCLQEELQAARPPADASHRPQTNVNRELPE
ncbi:hypothetical protein HNY73_017503 [Argiope bruennichi]|uniref:Uncharacterized protein n=1 Tax=Argiope bruennichi TaxID=94029 RepID=A0A8T0EB77_ARGBR|nr:hypothetical protein HNY73_017503 [Argiope bruennichi]